MPQESTNQSQPMTGRTISGSLPRPMATIQLGYDSEQERWSGILTSTNERVVVRASSRLAGSVLEQLLGDWQYRHDQTHPGEITMELHA